MGKIFFAFSGYQNPEFDVKNVLENGYEIWNLTKLNFDEFVVAIKREIPPLNGNITDDNYYKGMIWERDMPKLYENCRWGIMLPTPETRNWGFDDESLFCINLFSPEFLYPLFRVEDLGIQAPPISDTKFDKFIGIRGLQEQWNLFDSNFVSFHKKLLPALPFTHWLSDRVQSWDVEDYRIWNACMAFDELKQYHNSKKPWRAGMEYTEQGIILETLFTLSEEKTEITYRMKKRVAALLENTFPDIETHMQELYKRRSNYVHGTTFEAIQRSGDSYSGLVDFEFCENSTKYLRFAITAYLYLHSMSFATQNSQQRLVNLIEKTVLNTELRNSMREKVEEIFSLMPR